MWEVLRDNSDLTEKDIEDKTMEIDGRDGKMGAQITDCPSCGRPTNTKRTCCVISGAELSKLHKFEV
jgi:predicted hydrocarbon binding protein